MEVVKILEAGRLVDETHVEPGLEVRTLPRLVKVILMARPEVLCRVTVIRVVLVFLKLRKFGFTFYSLTFLAARSH